MLVQLLEQLNFSNELQAVVLVLCKVLNALDGHIFVQVKAESFGNDSKRAHSNHLFNRVVFQNWLPWYQFLLTKLRLGLLALLPDMVGGIECREVVRLGDIGQVVGLGGIIRPQVLGAVGHLAHGLDLVLFVVVREPLRLEVLQGT